MKLLVVEDTTQDLNVCRDSAARYAVERLRPIELVESQTVADALERIDNSFDGAIIDLRLERGGDEGNEVANRIVDLQYRIPIAIMTGTPAAADVNLSFIGVYKKGETQYSDLFDRFWDIRETGLTRIMGGRGEIERRLNQVFLKNLIPRIETWIAYGRVDSERTERALLRYTLNHLLQLLASDDEEYFPEEVYICPPLVEGIKTGSIVRKRNNGAFHVILSPACDLVLRASGEFKTERVLLAEIDGDEILNQVTGIQKTKNKKELKKIEECEHHNADAECYKIVLAYQQERVGRARNGLLRNSHDFFHHALPRTDCFPGGFLNFRKLTTWSKEDFDTAFEAPEIQISAPFIKDIVARFSSYYARQGQPDINFANLASQIASPPAQ
jgi:hypothetical protein